MCLASLHPIDAVLFLVFPACLGRHRGFCPASVVCLSLLFCVQWRFCGLGGKGGRASVSEDSQSHTSSALNRIRERGCVCDPFCWETARGYRNSMQMAGRPQLDLPKTSKADQPRPRSKSVYHPRAAPRRRPGQWGRSRFRLHRCHSFPHSCTIFAPSRLFDTFYSDNSDRAVCGPLTLPRQVGRKHTLNLGLRYGLTGRWPMKSDRGALHHSLGLMETRQGWHTLDSLDPRQ